MITLPVWIDDWVYQCCGQPRRMGEAVELELTFEGDIQADPGPDRIDVRDDGQVIIVGTATGPVTDDHDPTPGTLITSGDVQFAIRGDAPARHVMCSGRLWEIRHGWTTGRTSGELAAVRWRPAIVRPTGEGGGVIEGYEAGEEHASTEDWRERADDGEWHGWALELTVNVGGHVARGSHGVARLGE